MQTRVVIDSLVFQKIMHWINKSNYEVSGLGKITYTDGTIRVCDAILLPQKNGSTHTDIEGVDVSKAMYTLRDSPGDLRWWWHSHVDMDVFWSGTDWNTIRQISAGGWFVSTVFNKRREMRSCLNMTQPLKLCFDQLPTSVYQYVDPETVKLWDADYEKNVDNVYKPPKRIWTYPGAYQDDGEPVGKQLALPGSTDDKGSAIEKEDENGNTTQYTRKDLARYGLNPDDIEWANRPEAADRGAPRGSPPVDANGRTGGW